MVIPTDPALWINSVGIMLEILGFIILLPRAIHWIQFRGREAKGSHRIRDRRKTSSISWGISLVITGLLGQLFSTFFL